MYEAAQKPQQDTNSPPPEFQPASPLATQALFETAVSREIDDRTKAWVTEHGYPLDFTCGKVGDKIVHVSLRFPKDNRSQYPIDSNGRAELLEKPEQGYFDLQRGEDGIVKLDFIVSRDLIIKLGESGSAHVPTYHAPPPGMVSARETFEPIRKPVDEATAWRLVHTIRTMQSVQAHSAN